MTNLRYSHAQEPSGHCLEMSFGDDLGTVKLRFSKTSDDPGDPVDLEAVLMQAGVSDEEAQRFANAYWQNHSRPREPKAP